MDPSPVTLRPSPLTLDPSPLTRFEEWLIVIFMIILSEVRGVAEGRGRGGVGEG